VPAGLYRAHHDLACVDADTDLDSGASAPPKLIATSAKIVACRDGSVNRALWMIFVRDWCGAHRRSTANY
jgi:hypothetical protein